MAIHRLLGVRPSGVGPGTTVGHLNHPQLKELTKTRGGILGTLVDMDILGTECVQGWINEELEIFTYISKGNFGDGSCCPGEEVWIQMTMESMIYARV